MTESELDKINNLANALKNNPSNKELENQFFTLIRKNITNLVNKKLFNKDDTEDVIQELLIHSLEIFKKWAPNRQCPFTAFHIVALKNRLIVLIQRAQNQHHSVINNKADIDHCKLPTAKDLVKEIENKDFIIKLKKALQKDTCAIEMLTLMEFLFGSFKENCINVSEIAKRIGISVPTAHKVLTRIKIKAKELLQD